MEIIYRYIYYKEGKKISIYSKLTFRDFVIKHIKKFDFLPSEIEVYKKIKQKTKRDY